jgi:hypothetical protein
MRTAVLLCAIAVVSGGGIAMTGSATELSSIVGEFDVNDLSREALDVASRDAPARESRDRPATATGERSATAALHIRDLTREATVTTGEQFVVSATVANAGNVETTETVRLMIDRDSDGAFEPAGSTREVTLGPNESATVEFSRSTDDSDRGTHPYAVETDSERATGTLRVRRPATFRVSGVTTAEYYVRDAGTDGSDDALRVTVRNRGDLDGERSVRYAVDADRDGTFEEAETIAAPTVAVESGATVRLNFPVPTEELAAGAYEYRVSTPSDGVTGEISVREPADLAIERLDAPTAVDRGDPFVVSATVTNAGDVAGNATLEFDAPESFEIASVSVADSLAGPVEVAASDDESGTNGTGSANGTSRWTITFGANDTARANAPPETNGTAGTNEGAGAEEVSGTNASTGANASAESNRTRQSDPASQPVSLSGGETAVVRFRASTERSSPGNYTYGVSLDGSENRSDVVVRGAQFDVSDLGVPDTVDAGETFTASATVANAGNADGDRRVSFVIDVDDDSRPERVGLDRSIHLDVGEETSVEFEVPTERDDLAGLPADLDEGSYVVGIATESTDRTGVVALDSSGGSSHSNEAGEPGDESEKATLDEITQSKYGLYFDELSGETKGQVREIYRRQPFADGLAVTEVLSREEIARQRYGIETRGEFDFTALDVETQQRIERNFDAQFRVDAHDAVESWEELAQRTYGKSFDALTDDQRRTVKRQYEEQFDGGIH